jgi:hypothetical protein
MILLQFCVEKMIFVDLINVFVAFAQLIYKIRG